MIETSTVESDILDIDRQPREFGPDQRIAISSLIKYVSDVRELEEGEIAERDVAMLTSQYIASGLYVAHETRGRVANAHGHVVFPAGEYKVITTSPERVAAVAASGVWKKRQSTQDKERVEQIAGRASGHALVSKLEKTTELKEALGQRQASLQAVISELKAAGGTGFFAHYPSSRLRVMLANAEQEIFSTLDVTATTKGWSEEQYSRAKRVLGWKLFGDHEDRYRMWKEFTPMVYHYARNRKLVVRSVEDRLKREIRKYQHFLDDDK